MINWVTYDSSVFTLDIKTVYFRSFLFHYLYKKVFFFYSYQLVLISANLVRYYIGIFYLSNRSGWRSGICP